MTVVTKTFRLLGQAAVTGAVLMSSFALSKPAAAISANVRFFEDYSWCDAQMLGKFWEITPDDAKFDAGDMILDGEQYVVEDKLTYARQEYSGQGLCHFSYEGYSYDDMVAVADYWQTTVFDAKTSINNKLEAGLHREARDVVESARQVADLFPAARQVIVFENLSRNGVTLGYLVERADGTWVEKSANGQDQSFFRLRLQDHLGLILRDDSRGVELWLGNDNTIQYTAAGAAELTPLYAIRSWRS